MPTTASAAPFVKSDIQSPTLIRRVATLADLQSISVTSSAVTSVYVEGRLVSGDGYTGTFYKLTGDQSLNPFVLTDTLQGIYVKPAVPGDGTTGVWVRQYQGPVLMEWFGSTAAEIQVAMNVAEGKTLKLKYGETYTLTAQVVLPFGGLTLDATGATIEREVGYVAVAPLIYGLSITAPVEIYGGYFKGLVGVGASIVDISSFSSFRSVQSDYSEAGTWSVTIRSATKVDVETSNFHDTLSGLQVSDCGLIRVVDNDFQDLAFSGVVASATSGNDVREVILGGNRFLRTGDTAAFIRCFANSTLKNVIASNNIFYDIGKSALKLSIPVGNANAVIETAVIEGNTVRGFAFHIASMAIGVFRDSADVTSTLSNITISSNSIDGTLYDGTTSLLTAGLVGIRTGYVDNLVMAGNSVSNTNDAGFVISSINSLNFQGVAYNCSTTVGAYLAGMAFSIINNAVINAVSSNTVNGDGIRLERVRDGIITGSFNDNQTYGIVEVSGGTDLERTKHNSLTFSAKGNGTAPILYGTFSDSMENNSFDDSGSRHTGDSVRRNALNTDFGVNHSNDGFSYWNTTTTALNIWDGDAWVLADGTAAP